MLTILYQDNHLLCLDKPGGLLTQPSGTDRDSLEAQGKTWIKEVFHKPGAVFLEAVHRIDAVACGVVMFARTSKALSRLGTAIRDGQCSKEYRVLAEGTMPQKAGSLRNWMVHEEHFARIVASPGGEAKEAVLDYEVLEKRRDGLQLLRVMLKSGRYHQIRAQLAHQGCPIVGDARYGSQVPYKKDAIALQHYRLRLQHPVSREMMDFVSRIVL